MSPGRDDLLCKTFPLLYADRLASTVNTCMSWGFEVDDGWFDIIWNLSKKLEPLIAAELNKHCVCGHSFHGAVCQDSVFCSCNTFVDLHPRASQVKEKYGTLRFYMDHSTQAMDTLINDAEDESAKTCEVCGREGSLRSDGWITTCCNPCYGIKKNGLDRVLEDLPE